MTIEERIEILIGGYPEFFVVERIDFMGQFINKEWWPTTLNLDRNGNGVIIDGNRLIQTKDIFTIDGITILDRKDDLTTKLKKLIEDIGAEVVEGCIELGGQ